MEKENFTILIIEDQKFNTDLFGKAFEHYNILTAHTGTQGLELYQSHRPNIVFLDIGLPDISGFKVLEELRKLDPQAHVVMLSNFDSKNYVIRCELLGAMGFLSKPYKKEAIQAYIDQIKAK